MQLKPQTEYKYTNKEVCQRLKEALAAMEIKGANVFKIRAYQNAISSIESITNSVYDLWQNNQLDQIMGMGVSLKGHINELFTTGKVEEFTALKKDLPAGMFALIGIKGVGAKTAFKLATAFNLNDMETAVEKVRQAATESKIQQLPGFAEKKEADILKAIEQEKMNKNVMPRLLLNQAEEISQRIADYMSKETAVEKIETLGSLCRRASTVGDLDIAVATKSPDVVIKHFLEFPEVEEVTGGGDKKASVRLKNGVQVDIRTSDPSSFGSMEQYFIGSKQHNVVLRTYALEKGMSLSEYGIKVSGKLHEFASEKAFYKKIGLEWIPPEIRQGKDEVELAAKKSLPDLITIGDVKGDLHVHTNLSDGVNTLDEMVQAGTSKGYQYMGISDHSPSLQNRGKYEVLGLIEGFRNKIEHINSSQNNIRVLFGYEVNILVDGELSLSDDVMSKLDYVVASVHSSFEQSREKATERLISAVKNPLVTVIGHPSGRLINERAPLDLDWDKIFDATEEYNKILEINCQPNRLDLPDDLVYTAQKRGIKFLISSDAHSVGSLDLMKYGVDVARRGWLTKDQVINTLPKDALIKEFVRYNKSVRKI
ncbi:MAG: DNA polymerase/3'-5' exonuclease PolX [Patescibacteria group bacterium]